MQAYGMEGAQTIMSLEPEAQGRANDTDGGDSNGRKIVEGPMGRICKLGRDQWHHKCTQT